MTHPGTTADEKTYNIKIKGGEHTMYGVSVNTNASDA